MEKKQQKTSVQFIILTFMITWMIWGLASTMFKTSNVGTSFITVGTFIPSLVGLMMTYRVGGLIRLKQLLRSTLNPNLGGLTYAFIFGLAPITMLISYVVLRVFGYPIPTSEFPYYVFLLVFGYVLVFLGPLGEEIGWRGFLLKQMLNQFSPWKASIYLGLIWSLWHVPLFFIHSTLQFNLALTFGFGRAFMAYMLYTIMITVQLTILWLISKGSVLSAILFHAMANATLGMMPLIASTSGAITLLSVMIIITLILIVVNKKRLMTNH